MRQAFPTEQNKGEPGGGSLLRVHYGQAQQQLYQKVPGPEAKPCKMGPLCGGPVVIYQASLLVDECQCGEATYEYYQLEDIETESPVSAAIQLLLTADVHGGDYSY
eukprot:5389967-Prymnesium_polylepis.2